VKPPKPGSAEAALRSHALAYPEAREDFPWGERVVKVRGKVFVFLGRPEDGGLSLSVKLPGSATRRSAAARSPTGYARKAAGSPRASVRTEAAAAASAGSTRATARSPRSASPRR
jgi:hypothetical protein